MSAIHKHLGRKFGRWTVIAIPDKRTDKTNPYWTCRCECGTEKTCNIGSVVSGRSKSCGCLSHELIGKRATTHGLSLTPTWHVWTQMNKRCCTPSCKSFKDYGGRGIYVCDEWRHDFPAFLRDMGERPSAKHSIDRKDNDGPYCKDNCRWATKREQANNTRANLRIETGETLAEAARRIGCTYPTIYRAFKRGELS